MEKLVKVFTRDFALFACEYWLSELIEKFQKAVGVTYRDAPLVSNGKALQAFYLERDIEAVKNASIERFKKEPNYYFDNRGSFLQDTAESRRLIEELKDAEFSKETVNVLQHRFTTIFPMTRFCNFIPYFWADDVRKKLGKNAGPLIKAALEDRAKSEGVFELVDTLLRKIIAKKLKQIGKPEIFAKFLTNAELDALIDGKEINWHEIGGRTAGFVYCDEKIYATPVYQNIFKLHNYIYIEDKAVGNQVKGTVAVAKGIVKGKAQVIYALEEVAKFKQGSVMVTPMTVPEFIPAMKKASAVVTDEGGVTCHAAIVCRELNIPCIIGTKVATKVFKDGNEVEVNTVNGTVVKVK